MEPRLTRKDIQSWVKVPEDLKDPQVFQVQTWLLEALFGWKGSGISNIEQVSKTMLELKALEDSDLTEVMVYGHYLCKVWARWMLESMAERIHQRLEQGMFKLKEAMQSLELGQLTNEEVSFQSA